MNIEISIPNIRIYDYVEKANISHWGELLRFDHGRLRLELREGEFQEIIVIKDDWVRALEIMANKYPEDFMALFMDQGDMRTGDLMIQCAVFGSRKYSC